MLIFFYNERRGLSPISLSARDALLCPGDKLKAVQPNSVENFDISVAGSFCKGDSLSPMFVAAEIKPQACQ